MFNLAALAFPKFPKTFRIIWAVDDEMISMVPPRLSNSVKIPRMYRVAVCADPAGVQVDSRRWRW